MQEMLSEKTVRTFSVVFLDNCILMRGEEREILIAGDLLIKEETKVLWIETYYATLIKDTGKITERSCQRDTTKRSNAPARVSKEDISYSNSTTVSPMKIPIRPYFPNIQRKKCHNQ